MKKYLKLKYKIFYHIHQGHFRQAQETLQNSIVLVEMDPVQHSFLQAKIYLYEAAYSQAVTLLEMYLKQSPADLDGLCDLALCYYHLGLTAALDETLDKAAQCLKKEMNILSVQKTLDHSIFLAKLFEERAQLEAASEILALLPTSKMTAQQLQALRIQLLRIAVEKEDETNASDLYAQIIAGVEHNLSFEVEREHTLLLADAFLFGFQQAQERYSYISKKNLCTADRSFLVSEMTELAILVQDREFLRRHPLSGENESEYERIQSQLVELFLQGEHSPSLSILRYEKSLSLMSLLRVLRQALILFPHAGEYESWSMRYRFHCMQVTHRGLRMKFLGVINKAAEKVVINISGQVVTYEGRVGSLKSDLFWQLIESFQNNQMEVPIEDVIQMVYEEVPNDQHFDRLRIAISRLNKKLRVSHNIETLFKVNRSKVSLVVPLEKVVS
ncbi:MAG: hypothetical protein AAGB31_06710 [Bdellovibrio sp.]